MKILLLILILFSSLVFSKKITENELRIGKPGSTDNKVLSLGVDRAIRFNSSLTALEQTIDGGSNWTEVGGSTFNSPLTTKGDFLSHDGTNAIRIAAGLDGTFLQYNSLSVSGFDQVSLDINYAVSDSLNEETPLKLGDKKIKRFSFDFNDYNDGDTLDLGFNSANLVSNSSFDSDLTPWVVPTNNPSVHDPAIWEAGEMKAESTASTVTLMKYLGLMEPGKRYTLNFDVRRTSGTGNFNVEIDISDNSLNNAELLNLFTRTGKNGSTQITSDGTYSITFTAPASADSLLFGNQSTAVPQVIYYDNIELFEENTAKNIIRVGGDYKTSTGNFKPTNTNGVFINSSGQLEIEKIATTQPGGRMFVEYITE